MDPLTLFGLVAVTMMLACYALEDRAPIYVLAFAGRPLSTGTVYLGVGSYYLGFNAGTQVRRMRTKIRTR